MTAEISARGRQRAIGHEEYSLYSSLSEDELVQMAIEQSLADKTRGPTTAEATASTCVNRQPTHFYPWTRSTVPPENLSASGPKGLFQGVMQKYKNSQLAPVDPVLKAIKEGDEEALKAMIKAGKNLAEPNKEGWLPLHEAAYYGQLGCLKALQQAYPAVIDQRTLQEETALYLATCRGHLDCLLSLLQAGAEPDISNKSRETPLYKGADINTQASDNASALYEACKNEHEDVVEFLLSQGADANKANKDGLLPLHIASKKGNYRIVQMLLPVTSRTRVRRSGISPLHLAAERNHDGVLEALLGARFDVNAPLAPERARLYEDRRSSALYFAVVNNNVYATELLLLAGADPNRDLISPLLVAIRHGCLRTMQLLLDHGANIDAYIATHPTAFPATIMFAMKYLSLLKFLMDLGCDGEPCFSCLYGNGPHPPPPSRSNRFSDTPATEKGPSVVQFCEILSTPEVSRWAGPIIDVLLDYVGNVQLCSRLKEHIDSFEDWAVIKEKAELPRPLAHLCRLRVRKAVGKHRIKLLDALPLPGRLIRYLKYENTQ
ncbi:ankyrin repeat and SOCS box protein 2 isoform X3 [Ursus maritimus]|uniref:Ankyrin repeat and SOCS box protein 2 isoform X3 n=1 Tax=Ursus maritimus TaxID=29073 RepID=A0A8M1GNY3_URSMA|nr:ankyrin repeat and SOCS box protein 2 isoform X3 [Ursus maritimus]